MGMVETCYGPVEQEVMARAGNIRLLICDVDGVLSDGLIFMGNNGEELKAFNVRDGYGIRCLKTSDIEMAIITGRSAHYVTRIAGGRGAVRELCDIILLAQNKLEDAKGLSI